LEIERGVQPNCSDAAFRIITNRMQPRDVKKIEAALKHLEQKLNKEGYDNALKWQSDELRGSRGISISGDVVYNNSDRVFSAIRKFLGRRLEPDELDDRTNELISGCEYANPNCDINNIITCYDCESIYCPYENSLNIVDVAWSSKCPKCGRKLRYFVDESKWRCIWKPCRISIRASKAETARIFAELIKGNAEILRDTKERLWKKSLMV